MKQTIQNRLQLLRAQLTVYQVNAFIIPGTDPHQSEYIASHWKGREWISGFNGSAGTVVVLENQAGLWTDSRYFLQATAQLEGTGIDLYKEGLSGTPSIGEFLRSKLGRGQTVGIDGRMFSVAQVNELKEQLEPKGISLRVCDDFLKDIWSDRPPKPEHIAEVYPLEYAGQRCTDKIKIIRTSLEEQDINACFICALDQVAWVLNMRGNDIPCNPVFTSCLLITRQHAILFMDSVKATVEVRHHLETEGVKLLPYENAETYLHSLEETNILMDPSKTNYAFYKAVNKNCKVVFGQLPVAMLKAVRNNTEIEGLHHAMQRDGVALVKFLMWLQEAVPNGNETEISIDNKLTCFRSAQPLYKGKSFGTIAGYGPHGAIVHYGATPQSNATLLPKGLLLLDSGAQYLDGTTDITRTIALGPLTEEERMDYTLVLKGHIALATAVFPIGTRGAQLDVLARMPLWQHRMNYLHGTGHGVGHYLNVHEGPQNIRLNENPTPLLPGMLTSNEPGIYKDGSHGVRIENLVLVCQHGEGLFGPYYEFETVTLCPICKEPIIKEMLSPEEITWLNNYHKKVYKLLSPSLEPHEQAWLLQATAPL